MLPYYVALVSEIPGLSTSDLTLVAAALQKQVTRDFAPIWNVQATVSAFTSLDDVPLGYWHIIVRDDIQQQGAEGVHLSKDGQPFALVKMSNTWSLTASHECLEMLSDPFGNRITAGQSPVQDQGRVEFLLEVCDPCEAPDFAYTANGILVSDFYTPNFFDPVKAQGVRYSYTGVITGPREILKGGYLSWHEPISNHWWQQRWFGASQEVIDLGTIDGDSRSLRASIDARTPRSGLPGDSSVLLSQQNNSTQIAKATNAQASNLRQEINNLIRGD